MKAYTTKTSSKEEAFKILEKVMGNGCKCAAIRHEIYVLPDHEEELYFVEIQAKNIEEAESFSGLKRRGKIK